MGFCNLHTKVKQLAYRHVSGVNILHLSVDAWHAIILMCQRLKLMECQASDFIPLKLKTSVTEIACFKCHTPRIQLTWPCHHCYWSRQEACASVSPIYNSRAGRLYDHVSVIHTRPVTYRHRNMLTSTSSINYDFSENCIKCYFILNSDTHFCKWPFSTSHKFAIQIEIKNDFQFQQSDIITTSIVE